MVPHRSAEGKVARKFYVSAIATTTTLQTRSVCFYTPTAMLMVEIVIITLCLLSYPNTLWSPKCSHSLKLTSPRGTLFLIRTGQVTLRLCQIMYIRLIRPLYSLSRTLSLLLSISPWERALVSNLLWGGKTLPENSERYPSSSSSSARTRRSTDMDGGLKDAASIERKPCHFSSPKPPYIK